MRTLTQTRAAIVTFKRTRVEINGCTAQFRKSYYSLASFCTHKPQATGTKAQQESFVQAQYVSLPASSSNNIYTGNGKNVTLILSGPAAYDGRVCSS